MKINPNRQKSMCVAIDVIEMSLGQAGILLAEVIKPVTDTPNEAMPDRISVKTGVVLQLLGHIGTAYAITKTEQKANESTDGEVSDEFVRETLRAALAGLELCATKEDVNG